MIFRENSAHGEWCAILLPLALLVSYSQNSEKESQISIQIILLSIAMSVFSFNLAYQIIYSALKQESGSIWRHFLECLISDLFERRASVLARKTRKISKMAQSYFDPLPRTIEEARRMRLLSSSALQSSAIATAQSRYRKLSLQQPSTQSEKSSSKRKLSLSEKLQSSPESILIDLQKEETYLANLQNYEFGHFEFGLIALLGLAIAFSSFNVFTTVLFMTTLLGFVIVLPRLFLSFKKTFTFGEGCLLLQSVFIYAAHSVIQLSNIQKIKDIPVTEAEILVIFSRILVLSAGSLSMLFWIPQLRWINSTQSTFLAAAFTFLATLFFPYLNWICDRNVLYWVVFYVWDEPGRLAVVSLYAVAFTIECSSCHGHNNMETIHISLQKFSLGRIAFHLLLVAANTAGIFFDPNLLHLVSNISFALCLYAENFYLLQTENKIGKSQLGANLYRCYILAGVSLPLWLSNSLNGELSADRMLVLLSGALTVGIGNAVTYLAYIQGRKTKFPDSDKCVEGAVCSVVAQLFFIWILDKVDLVYIGGKGLSILLTTLALAILEALNTQTDVLVLPFIGYIIFSWELML